MNLESTVTIFTDGSSRGNRGGGGGAAIIIFPDSNDNRGEFKVESLKWKVTEIGGREDHTTNNRMELTAVIEALKGSTFLPIQGQTFVLYSDSSYVINGITKWVSGWQKNGWKTGGKKEVMNQDLWEKLVEVSAGKKIEWLYVGGHVGVAGNERCDEIATAFSGGMKPELYSGVLKNYRIKNILDLQGRTLDRKKGSTLDARRRSKAKAYSYVSTVLGVVQVHKTWVECEKRVKGIAGAKFQKALDAEEEKMLIQKWGRG